MTFEEKKIKTLQDRENEIWQRFQDILDNDVLDEIAELIEINLELEELANQ